MNETGSIREYCIKYVTDLIAPIYEHSTNHESHFPVKNSMDTLKNSG